MAAPISGQVGGRETLDNNITNAPAPVPQATGVQPNLDTQGAGNSGIPSGYVPSNAYNLIPKPPIEEVAVDGDAPLVEYPQGTPDTNRIVSSANTKVGI